MKDGATVVGKYEYDAIGRRVKRHIDSQSPAGPNGIDRYEHLFYNGEQIIETRNTANVNDAAQNLQPKYQYVWSLRYIDAPVLRDENTDTDSLCDDARIYFLNDANMNVTSLVDTAGDALERYVYDPYGRVTIYDATWSNTRSSSSYSNTTLYTGRDLDPETGLYFYRARYYSAEFGRFLSQDPIGPIVEYVVFYEYAGSNPGGHLDPSGLDPLRPLKLKYRALLVVTPVFGISISGLKNPNVLKGHACILLETWIPYPGILPAKPTASLGLFLLRWRGDAPQDTLIPVWLPTQTSIELLSAATSGRTMIASGPVGTVRDTMGWMMPAKLSQWGIFLTPGSPCTAMDNSKDLKKSKGHPITPRKGMNDKELNECILRETGAMALEAQSAKREYYISPWKDSRTCNSVSWEILERCHASVAVNKADLPGWGRPFSRDKANPAW